MTTITLTREVPCRAIACRNGCCPTGEVCLTCGGTGTEEREIEVRGAVDPPDSSVGLGATPQIDRVRWLDTGEPVELTDAEERAAEEALVEYEPDEEDDDDDTDDDE